MFSSPYYCLHYSGFADIDSHRTIVTTRRNRKGSNMCRTVGAVHAISCVGANVRLLLFTAHRCLGWGAATVQSCVGTVNTHLQHSNYSQCQKGTDTISVTSTAVRTRTEARRDWTVNYCHIVLYDQCAGCNTSDCNHVMAHYS